MVEFDDFLHAIDSPALRQIASHWHDAVSGGRPPSWSDIKPAPIAAYLPIVWSFRFDRETGRFTGRLAGEEISRVLGRNFRGLPLEEAHPIQSLPWVHALCLRVVSEPAGFYGSGRISRQGDKYGAGQRLLLPLSTDGMSSDGIIGATQYDLTGMNPDLPIEPVNDNELWLSLKSL